MWLKLIKNEKDGPDGSPDVRLRGCGRGLHCRQRVPIILELLARSPHLTARELAELMGSREGTIRADLKVVAEMRNAWRKMHARDAPDPPPLRACNVSWRREGGWRLKPFSPAPPLL